MKFNFELDTFQKTAFQKIDAGENVLISAPTASGKTVPALYAISEALKKGQKVIYTSPIKSLSNQKYHEFKQKFRELGSVGILTGDIKFGLQSDILVMTAEILRDLIFKDSPTKASLEVDLDINNDVSTIIMDEIHYMGDSHRGKVWEETLMLLNPKIQLVLLSATMGNAEDLSEWLTDIKGVKTNLIVKKDRVIPLKHFMYYHYQKNGAKLSKSLDKQVRKTGNSLIHIKSGNTFNEVSYNKIAKLKYDMYNHNHASGFASVKGLLGHLKNKKMLPALFFVFSKKQTEDYANNIHMRLNNKEEQQRVRHTVRQFLHRLQNKDIYFKSQQYPKLLQLWQNGIAYHHSGLRSVFKELIEILAAQGLIKAIFATETFAVGINAPIKTVVFLSLHKHSDEGWRYINPTEYDQMAGRAGRRGLDTVGNVVILSNTVQLMNPIQLNKMINGKSRNIESRFEFDYQMILRILTNSKMNAGEMKKRTFAGWRLKKQLEKELSTFRVRPVLNEKSLKFHRYHEMVKVGGTGPMTAEDEQLKKLIENDKGLLWHAQEDKKRWENVYLRDDLEKQVSDTSDIQVKMKELKNLGYLNDKMKPTGKGIIGSGITEVNELLLTEIVFSGIFDTLSGPEIVGLLASLMNKSYRTEINEATMHELRVPRKMLAGLRGAINLSKKIENIIPEEYDHEFNFDMAEYAYRWARGDSYHDLYFNNYDGVFVKDILRLDNMVAKVKKILEYLENRNASKLTNIHEKLIRDIVTAESLYI